MSHVKTFVQVADSCASEVDVQIILVELFDELCFWFEKTYLDSLDQEFDSFFVIFEEGDFLKYPLVLDHEDLESNAWRNFKQK